MKLLLRGHEDRYAIEQLQLSLFPDEPMEPTDTPFDGNGAVSTLFVGKRWLTATAQLSLNGKTVRATRRLLAEKADVPTRRRLLQNAYYDAAMQLRSPPEWGSLSGVRPTKLTTKHLLEGGTLQSAQRLLQKRYHVSAERAILCAEASAATLTAKALLREGDISVYIGIPFCPTRCAYCSFVSASIERLAGLLPKYLDALEREIAFTGAELKKSGHRVRTLYIGGGTPTTLSAPQLKKLMTAIQTHFDLTGLIEYTIEGGRPDTLDLEKLTCLRSMGCTRISINPQSMNNAVLAAVGRRHTSEQTLQAYAQAQQAGFSDINTDLIAGLPEDSEDSFRASLEQVIALAPSNITVHTLALKKGADLFFSHLQLPTAEAVAAMLQTANRLLRAAGYAPYYLYRQKYMSGSFENVGWCKDGALGLYNIYMMEEMHSILSLGGGGMTKINRPDGTLCRFANAKFPQQYIDSMDELLRRKAEAIALL